MHDCISQILTRGVESLYHLQVQCERVFMPVIMAIIESPKALSGDRFSRQTYDNLRNSVRFTTTLRQIYDRANIHKIL